MKKYTIRYVIYSGIAFFQKKEKAIKIYIYFDHEVFTIFTRNETLIKNLILSNSIEVHIVWRNI